MSDEENKTQKPQIWNGVQHDNKCVSNWVDKDGAYFALYSDVKSGLPNVAISALTNGDTNLQILIDGKPKIVDLKKLYALLRLYEIIQGIPEEM